ncbi:MAG: recombination regulator RecX [Proteobacteria bacterium]|nr:recombination regulator RecX [Pseudomonadota bacterium]
MASLDKKTKSSPELRARMSAMGSLAMREHSFKELFDKLITKGHDESVVDKLLETLQRENLLDNLRFAEVYWRSRSRKGYGPLRISREIEAKGVDSPTSDSGLLAAKLDFELVIKQVYSKKYRGQHIVDYKDKVKRQNYLYQRGFPTDLIRMVIEN